MLSAMVLSATSPGPAAGTPAALGFSWDPLTVETLPNGLTIVVKEDHTAPLAVTDVWFGVGSRLETAALSGTAHFLEHCLFKGTPQRGPGQIAAEIEGFGGRTNAGTSIDYTHYYISCESRHIFKALEIHADVFRHSLLASAAIDAERPVILEEIKRAKDTPPRVLWDTLCENLFAVHPYRRPTLGFPETVREGITPEAMRSFFTDWYVPKNMAILVIGDVETRTIIARLKELYGDLPAREPPTFVPPTEPALAAPKVVRKEMDVDRGYLQLAFRTVSHAQVEDAGGLDLLGVILGMGRTSRLSIALREQSSLVTAISAGQLSLVDDGMFSIRAEFEPAEEARVLAGIRSEIRKVIEEPVGAQELQKAKDYLENLYIRTAETTEGKAEILGNAVVRGALAEEKQYLSTMQAITPARLQEMARRYLGQEGYVLVILGPRSKAVEVSPDAGKPAPAETRLFRLHNGLRLLHKPIRGSGLVGACLAIDAGSRREEAGKTGLSNLTSEMLFKGTSTRPGLQTLWDLESLGAEMGPSAEPDLLRISLSAPAKHAAEAIAIMADVTRSPTFPADAFKIERNKVLARLKSVPDNMFENTWRLFHATMYPGHPYGNYVLGTPEDVDRLTPKDLEEFHSRWFTPDRMILSLVGDLDASAAIKLAETQFGSFRPGPASASLKAAASPQAPTEFRRVLDARPKAQAMLCLGWLGPRIGHPDYAAMKVLSAVFGGGMSARLFVKIRNQASLAYAAQGVFPSRMDGGAFCAIIGTDPGAVDRVKEMVLAEIQDIMENGVPPAELERAVAYVSGQFALDHGSSARVAHYLAWFESIGAGFAYDRGYLDEVKAVTGADLQRVARTYLEPGKAILAITGSPRGKE